MKPKTKRQISKRLFKLAKCKSMLKELLEKTKDPECIRREIKVVEDEALSYVGKGPGHSDLFIACLVHDLRFEAENGTGRTDSEKTG